MTLKIHALILQSARGSAPPFYIEVDLFPEGRYTMPCVTISRRQFVKRAIPTTFVLAAGAMLWKSTESGVFSSGQGPAFAPWNNWRVDDGHPLHRLVRAAILAASPHNTQPWLFRLSGEDRIDLYADQSRWIGAIDPLHRELQIGLGCALENLILAAGANGLAPEVLTMPAADDPTHVASIVLTPAAMAQPDVYRAIPERHTNRTAYDVHRHLSNETLAHMTSLSTSNVTVMRWLTSEEEKKRLSEDIVRAAEDIAHDREQSESSRRWYRMDWASLERHRDGITLDAQGLPVLLRAIVKIDPRLADDPADRHWIAATRDVHVATAAAFGMILVQNACDPVARLETGRLWQRMHLWMTIHGIAAQPLNQINERVDRQFSLAVDPTWKREMDSLVHVPGWESALTFRVGYAVSSPVRSPRRDPAEVILG